MSVDEQVKKVALLEGWQNGPAWVELETDELHLDDGSVGMGVIFRIETPTDPSGGMELELGTGSLKLPGGPGRLHFWVAASFAQARELRDALTELLGEPEPQRRAPSPSGPHCDNTLPQGY